MSGAYYNENDRRAAAWLRELIQGGHIAEGEVDERSIVDVRAADLRGFDQHHFFAGIGGWSYALRLAGWSDARSVWTGSCPCQPFSDAGKRDAHDDERHIWPAFFRLIEEYRPRSIFGEQIANSLGRAWLDHVCADLESIGYAAASADLPACGIGAPHGRPRLYFLADSGIGGCEIERAAWLHADGQSRDDATRRGSLGDPWAGAEWLDCTDGRRPIEPGSFPLANGISGRVGLLRGYGNAIVPQVAAEVIGAYMDLER